MKFEISSCNLVVSGDLIQVLCSRPSLLINNSHPLNRVHKLKIHQSIKSQFFSSPLLLSSGGASGGNYKSPKHLQWQMNQFRLKSFSNLASTKDEKESERVAREVHYCWAQLFNKKSSKHERFFRDFFICDCEWSWASTMAVNPPLIEWKREEANRRWSEENVNTQQL